MEAFLTSPWVPAEWIQAAGLTPRRAWLVGLGKPLPVPAGVCAFAQASLRLAEAHPKSPVIFATTCDQMRRAFDEATRSHPRLFLFNVPSAVGSPTGRRMFRGELERLARFLRAEPTAAEPVLGGILEEYERARQRLREAASQLSARAFAKAVARYHWEGPAGVGSLQPGPSGTSPLGSRIPVGFVGAPLASVHWPLLEAVERGGARVALNATESGERSLLPRLTSESVSAKPLDALVDCYFDHITDVFLRPNQRLYDWLGDCIRARKLRGLVVWSWAGCDLWRAEAASLREAFGLPVLLLEAAELASDAPRELGRLQSFVEMLR